jgi:hypothetical protein
VEVVAEESKVPNSPHSEDNEVQLESERPMIDTTGKKEEHKL